MQHTKLNYLSRDPSGVSKPLTLKNVIFVYLAERGSSVASPITATTKDVGL